MKRLSLIVAMICALALLPQRASAALIVSLDPQPPKIHGLENVFVDINISGLDTLLGAFDLDFLYEPSVFVPLLVPPAGFGDHLGDVFLGEAVGGIDTSTPGVINLFEISLLLDFELDALQRDPGTGDLLDSFTLATVGLFRFDSSTGSPATTLVADNILLSDAIGNPIFPVANPTATVQIPEPATFSLFVLGLAGFGFLMRRRGTKS